ncbi:hypothetical protein HYX58_02495 [Candidatus Dependentiae bacterium]|nr:hypothetical protein [Candidatus Dependentiae bacterium]
MLKKYLVLVLILPFCVNAMKNQNRLLKDEGPILILGAEYVYTGGVLQGTVVTVEDTAERLMGGPFIYFYGNTASVDKIFNKNVYFAKDENGAGYFIDPSMVEKVERIYGRN